MEDAWHQLGHAPGHAFDVGIAFTDTDVDHLTDLMLFEGAARNAYAQQARCDRCAGG